MRDPEREPGEDPSETKLLIALANSKIDEARQICHELTATTEKVGKIRESIRTRRRKALFYRGRIPV